MSQVSPLAPVRVAPGGRPRSFGILSTFPPTACGIATFSAALSSGLVAGGATVDVVRCGPRPAMEDASVLAALGAGSDEEVDAAVAVLDATDVAIVQHEYGIYDGPDGEQLLRLLERVEVPLVVVAHTVLGAPTANQRRVLVRVCAAADAVVVMTESARSGLISDFGVPPAKVRVIPHGAATPGPDEDERPSARPAAPVLLTWGLLGPGKGIEWAIDAMAQLSGLRPRPTYVVAGATHPKVLACSGEDYRHMLVRRAWSSGVAPQLSFDDTYRDLASLTRLIRSADLVVLPYDSKDQVTSGVLVDAVAAGRPVVSTAFPHAVELLATGAGLVVPQRDPDALATAIRSVLSDESLSASMAAEARRLAPALSWEAVARQYSMLGDDVLASAT